MYIGTFSPSWTAADLKRWGYNSYKGFGWKPNERVATHFTVTADGTVTDERLAYVEKLLQEEVVKSFRLQREVDRLEEKLERQKAKLERQKLKLVAA